ncbi:MAG: AAA family ATPase [Myxococcota bacterium]
MAERIVSRRWSGPMGTGKSAHLQRTVRDAMLSGIRPISYLPIVTDVGLRTERVELDDRDVAEALGAVHLAGRLTRDLSSGERQRVRLASALSRSTRFAALDEPCRHLDPHHVASLDAVLAQRTSGGMSLAVTDGRAALSPELFTCELGSARGEGRAPDAAPRPQGDSMVLRIPDPFILSRTKDSKTKRGIRIERGALVVVRGPNGSGKTSLLEALARAARGKHRVGISRQEPEHQVFTTTAAHELRDVAAVHHGAPWCNGGEPFERLIANLALETWLARPTPRLPLGALSLLGAAIALWMGRDLVLLDEPTQGLDTQQARMLAGELVRCARAGARIVAATHDPELVSVANNTWTITDGVLEEGT